MRSRRNPPLDPLERLERVQRVSDTALSHLSVDDLLAETVTPDDDALIVDLSELSFIDSAGLHSLIELGTVLDERRQQLLLCLPPSSTIRRAIEIIGLPHAVSVYSDRSEAMEAVRASAMESRPIGPTEDA